jgi:hypothetical protein
MRQSAIRSCRAMAFAVGGMLSAAAPCHAQTAAQAAPAPALSSEQAYEKADPEVYAAARQYFPSDTVAVPNKRIFRLTRDQIDATIASLLPGYAVPSIKSVVARDSLQMNYEYAELLSFNAANSSGLSTWISDIAARVLKNPAGVINCPAGSSPECLATAARGFIIKAFRGDISEDRIAAFTKFYLAGVKTVGNNQATADLVEVVLNSPAFLFRKEVDINDRNRLSPAQLLQAVTYTIADVPPETLKLQSQNAAQYLRTGQDAGATISAILGSSAARDKLMRFFMAWLEIKEPGDFTISAKVFPEFNPKLETAMLAETTQFLRAQLSKPAPSLKDITQATQTIMSPALAPIYGAEAAGKSAAKPVDLNAAQRLGIFSQPALLASHSGPTNTRPIKRGVFWVRKVMCMEMEPPPADLHAQLYEMVGATERARIQASTGGQACIGCHKIINPFAFFQENYDALGRWRTVDNGVPIDASVLINFLDEDPTTTKGPVDALKTLTSSMMFKQCFVRQMFRFYMGRQEEAADDPLLRRMFFEFAHKDKQDIVTAVETLTSSDRIVRRQ